tara:strand:- start:3797 stop:4441 length:645 start_codon:yes stop_codon:yes gene_type:complete
MQLELDHIVLGADSLVQGLTYISEKFGVDVPPGGEHLQMGTHNCVMSLGASNYFEIIAIAPHLDAPARPRWFDFDNPDQRARLAEQPRILTWVVRTPDLNQTLSKTSEDLGEIVAMQRGDLNWQLTIREDGSLPFGGLCPSIIQWQYNSPPISNMTDLGCRVEHITLAHPELKNLKKVVQAIGADHFVSIEETNERSQSLKVDFATPSGLVMLD